MSNELDDLFEKKAVGPAQLGLGSLVGKAVGRVIPKKDTRSDLEQRMAEEYFDPVHDAEMARIKMQAMLNDFLSNDPVISTYDIDDVLEAFNQVSQLVPRSSLQPAVMRGQLRKLLQQQDAMEPFEASQLVEVEKGLKTVQEPEELPLVKMPGGDEDKKKD
jgi:hypothetical protein